MNKIWKPLLDLFVSLVFCSMMTINFLVEWNIINVLSLKTAADISIALAICTIIILFLGTFIYDIIVGDTGSDSKAGTVDKR